MTGSLIRMWLLGPCQVSSNPNFLCVSWWAGSAQCSSLSLNPQMHPAAPACQLRCTQVSLSAAAASRFLTPKCTLLLAHQGTCIQALLSARAAAPGLKSLKHHAGRSLGPLHVGIAECSSCDIVPEPSDAPRAAWHASPGGSP